LWQEAKGKIFALPYCMSIPVALEAKKTMKMKILLENIWHFTEISKYMQTVMPSEFL
jgi:hypothetical protein